MEIVHYVLGLPSADERIALEIGEQRAAEAIPLIIQRGLETAMNSINLDLEEQKKLEEKQHKKQESRQAALSDEKHQNDF